MSELKITFYIIIMNFDALPVLNKHKHGPSQTAEVNELKYESSIETNSVKETTPGGDTGNVNKTISAAFYIFLATVFLAPLSFWTNPYIPIELIKTLVIAVGILASAIVLGIAALKEKRLSLPPRGILWVSLLVGASTLISFYSSAITWKSFIGQGFELTTASFILVLFVAALIAMRFAKEQSGRAVLLLVGVVSSYLILFLFHLSRAIFGAKFLSLGRLDTITTSVIGNWSNIATFSIVVALISLVGLLTLKPSPKMRVVYWIILAISSISAIAVPDQRIWLAAAVVGLGLVIYFTLTFAKKSSTGGLSSYIRGIAWLPLAFLLVSAIVVYFNQSVYKVIPNKLASAGELVLPWQMTLDVTSSAIKSYPLLGVGPNNFSKAYIAYKPTIINSTDAWGVEFGNGFSLISTVVTNQGLFGLLSWILFFVFLGLCGAKALRNLSDDPEKRFLVISTYVTAVFLWLVTIIAVPAHALLFMAFVFTGLFAGSAMASGSLSGLVIYPQSRSYQRLFVVIIGILVLVAFIWSLVYIKRSMAMIEYANGVRILNQNGGLDKAAAYFAKAASLARSDAFWRAQAETGILQSRNLASAITAQSTSDESKATLEKIAEVLNESLSASRQAIAIDQSNYYNYLSEARVSELASEFKMENSYDNAVQAYVNAINRNPFNPSLYLSLANLQARNKKYDDALRTIGSSLQIKNNYLDAVFLLSQVYAAKGDLQNAIVAANFATELNPNNPVVLFQSGLLKYNAKDYSGSIKALEAALKAQPDYANVAYFLGLAYARVGQTEAALKIFEQLATTNPDNEEVALIVANLKAGKSIFAETKPAQAPEKRSALPIKEKR